MDRRRLVKVLAEDGFERGQSVTYPDHPLLARGPDVLGQHETRLVAWFVYTARSPSPRDRREASRILLSRLALPKGTRFGMVLVERRPNEMGGLELFDELELRDSSGKLTTREALQDDAAKAAEELRPFQVNRFARAWAGNRSHTSDKPGRSSLESRVAATRPLPGWARLEEGRIVADLRGARASSIAPRIQALAAAITYLDFGLEGGLGGLNETVSMLRGGDAELPLHTLRLPSSRKKTRTSDPYKAIRAAAFAGAEVEYPEES